MFRNSPIFNLRRLVIMFIILIVALLGWYLLTHGRLTISSASKNSIAVFTRLEDGVSRNPKSTDQAQNIVQSGTYSVSVKDRDGNRLIKNVKVGRVLMETSLNNKPTPYRISTIARNSLSDLVYTSRGLSSHEGGSFRQLDPTNITNDDLKDFNQAAYPNFIDTYQTGRSEIVGFIRTEDGIQPLRYNTINEQSVFYPLLSGVDPDDIHLEGNSAVFSLFNTRSGVVTIYGTARDDVTTVSLNNPDEISENNGQPVFSATSGVLATSIGPDFAATNDNKQELSNGDHTVRIFNIETKKAVRSFSFPSATILQISISPDNTYIAIRTNNQVGVYSLKTGSLLFSVPHSIEDFRWVDDEHYIFNSTEEGIFFGSVKDRMAQTLVSYDDVRPTSISYIQDGWLYFTGFNGTIPNADYPDAYRVDLSESATKNNLAGLRDFPHSGSGFYIDQLNGIVVVQLTRYTSGGEVSFDTDAKRRAESYVRSKLPDYSTADIRYVYVDLDF